MRTHLSNSRERLRRGNNAHTMQPEEPADMPAGPAQGTNLVA